MKAVFPILLLFVAVILCPSGVGAQINHPAPAKQESAKLDNKIYLKTFDISALSEGKKSVQYVQVFSKGKKYMLNMCGKEGMPEGLTLSLYNSKRKLLGTNVINGKHQTKVTFPCSATGLYYLVYTLSENTSEAVQMDCGKSVLSLKFEEKD